MKAILFCIFTLCICLSSNARIWTLSDRNLDIQFDDQSTLLKVTDKRCSKTWQQAPLKDKFIVKQTVQQENTLHVSLEGEFPLQVSFSLNESSALEVHLSAENKVVFEELAFPSAFVTPDPQHYILETDGEGLLLPSDDKKYPLGNGITYSCGGGLAMAWMGVVDNNFQSGYMAILDTPFDACLRTFRNNGLVTFSPVWLPSLGQFSYDRKVTYHFFDKGGYVAQCKKIQGLCLEKEPRDYPKRKSAKDACYGKDDWCSSHLCMGQRARSKLCQGVEIIGH